MWLSWLLLRRNFSSCWREPWFKLNQRPVSPPQTTQQRRTLWWRSGTDDLKCFFVFFLGRGYLLETFGNASRIPSKEKLFLKTEKNTNTKKKKKKSDWSRVCSFISRFPFLFFIFTTAMPKEGSTKASRLSMHKHQKQERPRTALEFYVTQWIKKKKIKWQKVCTVK